MLHTVIFDGEARETLNPKIESELVRTKWLTDASFMLPEEGEQQQAHRAWNQKVSRIRSNNAEYLTEIPEASHRI